MYDNFGIERYLKFLSINKILTNARPDSFALAENLMSFVISNVHCQILTINDMLIFLLIKVACATIDLNYSELGYLADHLLPEECRKLVAGAHFTAYMAPNAWGQAERAMPKDVPCMKLLLHWNSARGEGRGETHEALEHRLRQMGKHDLADWLGRTVFHQLGQDLDQSLREGLKEFAEEVSTTEGKVVIPLLQAYVEKEQAIEWTPTDTISVSLLCILIPFSLGLCLFAICRAFCRTRKRKKSKKRYEMLETEDTSSEDRFDVRDHQT